MRESKALSDIFMARKVARPTTRQHAGCGVAILEWRAKRPSNRGKKKGGDVQVIPISNPDQLTAFLEGANRRGRWGAGGRGRARLGPRRRRTHFPRRCAIWWPESSVRHHEYYRPARSFLKEHPDVCEEFPSDACGAHRVDQQKSSAGEAKS